MEKKLYIKPKYRIHKFEVSCLQNFNVTSGTDGEEGGAKGASTGSTSSMWENMDED